MALSFHTSLAAPLAVRQVSDTTFVSDSYGAEFSAFITHNDELFFTASTTGGYQHQLFKTDGNSLVQFDVDPGYAIGTQFIEFEGELYFRGDRGRGGGIELLRTAGDGLVEYDLNPDEYGSAPRNFTIAGDTLYFHANVLDVAGQSRTSLFAVRDSIVTPVADVDVMLSYPWHMAVDDALYFTANGRDGFELYRTDGATVQQVIDANPGPADSHPWPAGAINGDFYFTAIGPDGREAYRASGAGAVKLPLPPDPDPHGGALGFAPFAGQQYFLANGQNGYELYRTDGAGVWEYDLNPGAAGSYPQTYSSTIVGDRLLVPGGGPNGLTLFALDQAGNLTQQFEFFSDWRAQGAIVFHQFRGEAYFQAVGEDGPELYKTDGTTITQFNIVPDHSERGGALMYNAVELGDALYFTALTTEGWELVKTDGVTATVLDINPGTADSWPRDLQLIDDQLVFRARGPHGPAVYSTDGDLVQELARLTPYTVTEWDGRVVELESATTFARLDNQLFFLAHTAEGFKLHSISAIPEPAVWPQLGIAMTLAGGRLRRR
jgi:ELWxxDGT repeat protein